jgi:hypothetical protein
MVNHTAEKTTVANVLEPATKQLSPNKKKKIVHILQPEALRPLLD